MPLDHIEQHIRWTDKLLVMSDKVRTRDG